MRQQASSMEPPSFFDFHLDLSSFSEVCTPQCYLRGVPAPLLFYPTHPAMTPEPCILTSWTRGHSGRVIAF